MWTGATAVVIRKGGYESFRRAIKDTRDPEDVRVVLRPVHAVSERKVSETPYTVESHESHDVDYTSTVIGRRDKDGKWVGILCGEGPTWS